MPNSEFVVLDPVAHVEVEPKATAQVLQSLAGKTVAYHHARGPYLGVVAFADRLGELLQEHYEVANVVRLKSIVERGASGWSDPNLPALTRAVYDEYAEQVDCVVVGAAFCGGSTYWSIRAATEFQDRGVPTISLVSLAFKDLAEFTYGTQGYSEIPMLVLPDDFETKREPEMRVLAEANVHKAAALLAGERALAPTS